MMDPAFSAASPNPVPRPANTPLYEAAQAFEANFLAEMLRATSLGKTPELFGGGEGEAQFSSFLVRSYADRLTEAGGVGLADHVYRALERKS